MLDIVLEVFFTFHALKTRARERTAAPRRFPRHDHGLLDGTKSMGKQLRQVLGLRPELQPSWIKKLEPGVKIAIY